MTASRVNRRLPIFLLVALTAGCGTATKAPATARESTAEIDLSRPEKERSSWPAGLVPCAKDAPEGAGCAVRSPSAAPGPADAPRPAIDEKVWNVPIGPDDPVRGPADALVTLVVFADFECPFCSRLEPTLHTLEQRYGRDLRNLQLPF